MRIRDISLRKRLLFANVMMVVIPVCILMGIAGLILQGLRFSAGPDGNLVTLWPEKGPAMSIQYTVSSLKVNIDKLDHMDKPKVKDLMDDCHVLESLGIETAIVRQGHVLYCTPGANALRLQEAVYHKGGGQSSAMVWNDEGFYFTYTAPQGTAIFAAGDVPFLARGGIRPGTAKGLLHGVLFFMVCLALVLILGFGIYLSRLLSRQILEPLSALRQASAAIRNGNLDEPLQVTAGDELGEACRDFDAMRQELQRSRAERERYEQNRRELIAGISHDLSTPLTLLKGYACGILEGIAATPEKKHHYVELMYRSACTLERLVDSLFLFSKLELGRVPFHTEVVDLQQYFADFLGECAGDYEKRGLDLRLSHMGRGFWVALDRMQFQRVVENLLENSLKYKDGERVAVDIVLTQCGGQAGLAFADHGRGVPDEALPLLFDSFYRTDKARTDVKQGSGLGLAITKQIIEALGGTIKAEATPGGGLTIRMTLPIAKETKNSENDTDH